MDFDAKEFLKQFNEAPNVQQLKELKKAELFDVGIQLQLPVKMTMRKEQILQRIKGHFIEEGKIEKDVQGELPENSNVLLELKKIELEEKRLEREREEKRLEREERREQREAEREQRDAERELREKEMNMQREIELERIRTKAETEKRKSEASLKENASIVPKFSERDVEQFFLCFERVAETANWPKEKWTFLMQTVLTGKAQKAYAALPNGDAKDYEKAKQVILEAYELVPEAYRQKFRSWQRMKEQNHLQFAKDKEVLFDKWTKAENADTFEKLRNVILIEEFKNCLSPQIKVYLDERMPQNITEAARIADQYELTHKKPRSYYHYEKPRNYYTRSAEKYHEDKRQEKYYEDNRQYDNKNKQPEDMRKRETPRWKIECEHCKRKGHAKTECWQLHGRPEKYDRKPVTLVRETNCVPLVRETNCHLETEQEKSFPTSFYGVQVNEHDRYTSVDESEQLIEEGKQAFTKDGLAGNDKDDLYPVTVWRDTGAFQSLIVKDIVPVSHATYTGLCVPLRGVGGCISAPLHKLYVKTEIVEGTFIIGLVDREEIPIEGIDLIVGNDLAGCKVQVPRMITDMKEIEANEGEIKDHEAKENELKEIELAKESEQTTVCAVTRSMSKKEKSEKENEIDENIEEKEITFETNIDRCQLIKEQESDEELQNISAELNESDKNERIYFYKQNGILFRCWKPREATPEETWQEVHQIVIPKSYRQKVLSVAHENVLSGHLGVRKTHYRILKHFYWPKMYKDVANFCRTCHTCQIVGKHQLDPPKAPLIPIPACEEPFRNIIIDCVGPLPRTKMGHEYLFTIMCSSTRFPEAIPLRSINAKNICSALINFFTMVGLPKVIRSDQGTNFTSKIFSQVSEVLGVKHICSTAYHPESQGALERFHQTLKVMMKTYCEEHQKDWNLGIPMLLFAIRETVQDSLGFSPFELIYGHEVRGPLKLMKENMLSEEKKSTNLLDYVSEIKERLTEIQKSAKANLINSQSKMKKQFDRNTKERTFQQGEKVLLLLPISGDPMKARYQGPYMIQKKISEVNYVIETPDRRKKQRMCHINMLKKYHDRDEESTTESNPSDAVPESLVSASQTNLPALGDIKENSTGTSITMIASGESAAATSLTNLASPGDAEEEVNLIMPRMNNSKILENLDSHFQHVDSEQKEKIKEIIKEHKGIFSDHPQITTWAEHDVELSEERPIKQSPYRMNPEKREIMKKEVKYLKDHNIIENSNSNWSSPCILVPKPDKTHRFCTDYRKVNELTIADNYPLPNIETCIEQVGDSKIISKFDLLKGYYQVPLTERAKRISAFVTEEGLFQYKVMPFGMKNAASTFQRLANKVIENLDNCAVYIDDIIVYSNDWPDHLEQIRKLFQRIGEADLTINLSKSEIGKQSLNYLGFEIGHGKIKPIMAKVQAVVNFPVPNSRKELRRFLGMAGYYRKFCKNYADVVHPLTSLTSPKIKYTWSNECQVAFEQVKTMLASPPILSVPTFEKPFKLYVDASGLGLGALLAQDDEEGNEHPLSYYSKKFNHYERKYSTIEKEGLALVQSLRHFAYFLKGRRATFVYTDHNPLVFINRMKNDNQRLLRWSLLLQEYNIIIQHVPGRDNIIADRLSRS